MEKFFDWKYYVDSSPDLIEAKINTQKRATEHFLKFGYKENRIKIRNFDWKYYVDNNPDLPKAGINTEKLAYEHFFRFGHKENRLTAPKKIFPPCNCGKKKLK
ncbi:MAG: hypothetical protein Harvfovirus2_66 [Harvfovirus sp.]|uniref:Uncharacterized protein n=1 Tax=Harvfovirus sp. TaxID=2487768 RepID=A0A3G4ZZX6_9VIRU|nr:MAG: hypothetical protein Harvfovirus2_66 [Harvfovirus sp.]